MERSGEGASAHVSGVVPHSADRVWEALGRPKEWWVGEANVSMKKGGKFEIRQPGGWMRGRITSLKVNQELVISLPIATPHVAIETTLTVTLEPEGDKTRVTFDHLGPDVMGWMGELRNLEKGWRDTLVKLNQFLGKRT